jgi:hypothetical protein
MDKVMTCKEFLEALGQWPYSDMIGTFERWGDPVFVYVKLCSFGNYDNSCSVERANVKELVEYRLDGELDGCKWDSVYTGSYGTEAWGFQPEDLPATSKFYAVVLEMLDGLRDYPVLNDDALSEYELEAEQEALFDYILDDLRRELKGVGLERLADLEDGDLQAWLFREMERTSTYFEHEAGGTVYVDLSRIIKRIGWVD